MYIFIFIKIVDQIYFFISSVNIKTDFSRFVSFTSNNNKKTLFKIIYFPVRFLKLYSEKVYIFSVQTKHTIRFPCT